MVSAAATTLSAPNAAASFSSLPTPFCGETKTHFSGCANRRAQRLDRPVGVVGLGRDDRDVGIERRHLVECARRVGHVDADRRAASRRDTCRPRLCRRCRPSRAQDRAGRSESAVAALVGGSSSTSVEERARNRRDDQLRDPVAAPNRHGLGTEDWPSTHLHRRRDSRRRSCPASSDASRRCGAPRPLRGRTCASNPAGSAIENPGRHERARAGQERQLLRRPPAQRSAPAACSLM